MKRFIKEMKKIIKEKNIEYRNTWKNCNIKYLLAKLDNQFLKLNNRTISNKETMRILVHISNFSYFLFERLKERENKIGVD